jgi:hypothetical protein
LLQHSTPLHEHLDLLLECNVLTLFHFNTRDQDGQSSQVLILKAQRQTHNTKPSKTKALATTCQ